MSKAIIVCGTPGNGKTTHARQLTAASGATLLDIDTVTERLVWSNPATVRMIEILNISNAFIVSQSIKLCSISRAIICHFMML